MGSAVKVVVLVTVALTLSGHLAGAESLYNWTQEALQEQLDALTKSRYLIFPHVYRAFIDAGRMTGVYNISEQCQKELSHYYRALNTNKGWAWRFYDATGKQGSGLFLGALTWKGNFQECLNTLGYSGSGKNIGALFEQDESQPYPQYCSVFLAPPPWMHTIVDSLKLPFPVPMSPFIVDVCVPQDCTEDDLQSTVQQYINEHSWGSMNFTVTDTRCFKGRDITNDHAALFSMSVLLAIVCCVAIGTAYDIFLRRRKLRAKRGPEYMIGYQKDTKQYGILKVILAPPASKRGLQRRATVGGYEKSTQYHLAELKVDRENLLNRDQTTSLPDIPEDSATPDQSSPNGPRALNNIPFFKSASSQKGASNSAEFQQDDSKTADSQTDDFQKGDSQTNGDCGVDGADTDMKKLVENGSSEQSKPAALDRQNSMKRSSSDPGRLNADAEQVQTFFTSPAAQHNGHYVDSGFSPNVPLTPDSHKLVPSPAFEEHMPGGAPHHVQFHHTPHKGRQPSVYEGQVPANSDTFRERRHHGGPPSHVRHTPHTGRQGSIFERQMSQADDNDSEDPFEAVSNRHRLYDIPEEETKLMGSENGKPWSKPTPEIVIRPKPVEKERSLLSKIILSFSFRKATKRIIAEGSADTLFCLNGVRVLSICWIVLGNVYLVIYINPDVVDNHVDAVKLTQTFWVQAVINTTLAADSFYILSGTLGAYNFMKMKKDCQKKKLTEVMTIKEYFMMIFHRLVRIGPSYLLVIMAFTNLMPYMGRGPRWSYEIQSVRTCKSHWWANALFISNFYKSDTMCLPHTYYLVNDFQFGLLMPFVMVPMLVYPKVGFGLLGTLVMTQIISTLILDEGINGNVLRMTKTDYFSRIYVKPYCRVGVYAIGLGLGYLLWVTKRQVHFKRLPLTIFWVLSLFIICTLPYITLDENRQGGREWSSIETAMYEALSRPLWGLALSWVIFACSTGQGAFVNKLLSWNAFLPLCRITYGVYLLHPLLIAVVIGSRQAGFYLDFGELTYEFVADLVFSYIFAFILITFVECPFTTLEHSVRTHLGKLKKKS